ncbi:hypothetical protein D9M68_830750 [compost metagenome]
MLVSPDRSRRAPLDRSIATTEHGGHRLLGGVGLRRGVGAGHVRVGRDRVHHPGTGGEGLARQHIEARHGLGEGLYPEQRTRWQSGGDIGTVGIGAAGEGAQSVDRNQQSAGSGQAPLDEIASRHFPLGEGACQFGKVPSGIFRFPESRLGRISWKVHVSLLIADTPGITPVQK